jgi:hypothetical protein
MSRRVLGRKFREWSKIFSSYQILLMVGSCWLIRKLQASRSLKRARVSPVQVGTNNNVMPLHRNHPGQVNEMVSIEEVCLRD